MSGTDRIQSRRSAARPETRWLLTALLLTVLLALLVLLLPLGSSSSGGGSTGPTDPARVSLLRQEGWGVAAVVLIPVLLCAAPLLARGRARRPVTVVTTGLLGAVVVLGAASVGLLYLPSAVLMLVGALRQAR